MITSIALLSVSNILYSGAAIERCFLSIIPFLSEIFWHWRDQKQIWDLLCQNYCMVLQVNKKDRQIDIRKITSDGIAVKDLRKGKTK